jgi:rhodanese-related sulfurtransferase
MSEEPAVPQVDICALPTEFGNAAVLLDVREHDEWQRGHAPGALHIPMREVPARLDQIDPDAQLYVVCAVGARSMRVAQYLRQNDYRPVNVDGGMRAWASAGRPVITDNGGPGSI